MTMNDDVANVLKEANKEVEQVKLSEQMCFALYSTQHAMNRVYKPLLKKIGLTYPQLLVLMALWEEDKQLVSDIGKTLFLESNTLTPLLKRLETMGYLKRERCVDDERKVRVSLSKTGKALQGSTNCFPLAILDASGLDVGSATDLVQKITHLRHSLLAFSEK